MKKTIAIFALLICCALLSANSFTPKSLIFSDSYMLRAVGSEANYWNPALINKNRSQVWLPGLNLGVVAGNNAFDLDLYNYVMGLEYLDDADKQMIMDSMDGRLSLNLGSQLPLFGFTVKNVAISSTVKLSAKSAIDEEYLGLLLHGNGDGSQTFDFSREDTYLEALGYLDLTLGWGNIRLPLPHTLPDIRMGLAVSALGGIGNTSTEEFAGLLTTDLNGLNIRQDLLQRAGAGGWGAKGLVGLYTEPVKNLQVGATLDNILGFLNWEYLRKEYSFHLQADSLYALDLLDGTEGLVDTQFEEADTDPYVTKIPLEMRLAAKYEIKQLALTADYIKGYGNSSETTEQDRFALGAEVRPFTFLSLMLGFGSGNASYPWRTSCGIGFNLGHVELGLGIQSIKSLYPYYNSKGAGVATYFSIRTPL